MSIQRRILAGVLALGAAFGFTSGIAHLSGGHCAARRHQRFEERVAEVCTRAAQRVIEQDRR